MFRDDAVRLRDMLVHAREAVEILGETPREEFAANRVLSLALVRLVEIIGEAAANVSPERRESLPEIPWRAIIAARNRYIHAYGDVDLNIVWTIVSRDLPPLVNVLERALS